MDPFVLIVIIIGLLTLFFFLFSKNNERNTSGDVSIGHSVGNNATSTTTAAAALKKWKKARILISFELIQKIGLVSDAEDLYCISVVKSDKDEEKNRKIWDQMVESLGINKERILFCETQRGVVAMVRQLNIQLCLFSPKEKEASDILRKLPASANPPTIGVVRNLENFESVFFKCTGTELCK